MTAPSDYNGLIRTIDARADRARFYQAFDANGDGVISETELGSRLVYNSTAGNPGGQINYDRTLAALVPFPLAVGIAFEATRLASIDPQPHDLRMDVVITDAAVY